MQLPPIMTTIKAAGFSFTLLYGIGQLLIDSCVDDHGQVDVTLTADQAEMDCEDEKETSRMLDCETTASAHATLDGPVDVTEEDTASQDGHEDTQADEPEMRCQWAPFERDRENVVLEHGLSIKWLTNKGVYTFPYKQDGRALRQLYPVPSNCKGVSPSCWWLLLVAF
jgi:hypothetical protein